MNGTTTIVWSKVRAVIFDVDGTLYDQRLLRRRIVGEILRFYLLRPQRWSELRMVILFRRLREKLADENLELPAGEAIERVASQFKVSGAVVRGVMDEWIMQRPLRHLSFCRFPGIVEFIQELQNRKISVAVFSDYPAKEKLVALGLPAMLCVASEDGNVNRLKPHPRGLEVVAEKLGLTVAEGLFIGDRYERDGLCAINAGIPFLMKGKGFSKEIPSFHSYGELLSEFSNQ